MLDTAKPFSRGCLFKKQTRATQGYAPLHRNENKPRADCAGTRRFAMQNTDRSLLPSFLSRPEAEAGDGRSAPPLRRQLSAARGELPGAGKARRGPPAPPQAPEPRQLYGAPPAPSLPLRPHAPHRPGPRPGPAAARPSPPRPPPRLRPPAPPHTHRRGRPAAGPGRPARPAAPAAAPRDAAASAAPPPPPRRPSRPLRSSAPPPPAPARLSGSGRGQRDGEGTALGTAEPKLHGRPRPSPRRRRHAGRAAGRERGGDPRRRARGCPGSPGGVPAGRRGVALLRRVPPAEPRHGCRSAPRSLSRPALPGGFRHRVRRAPLPAVKVFRLDKKKKTKTRRPLPSHRRAALAAMPLHRSHRAGFSPRGSASSPPRRSQRRAG